MAAVFVNFSSSKTDLFKFGGSGATGLVQIAALDELINKANLAIYTGVSVSINQTVQYLLTFGDIIRFINFGKGLGSITITGIIFTGCDSKFSKNANFFKTLAPLRGQALAVSMLGYACKAVLISVNAELVAEPDTMLNFSLTFNIVSEGT